MSQDQVQSQPTRAEVIAAFAAEYAGWRLGGCPGYGFHAGFKARLVKAARKVGLGYAEAIGHVHREAYRIIDADGRADLSTARVQAGCSRGSS
jgi:hypothetical protein